MILKNGWCLFPKRERRIRTTILTFFVWYRGLENNRIEVLNNLGYPILASAEVGRGFGDAFIRKPPKEE